MGKAIALDYKLVMLECSLFSERWDAVYKSLFDKTVTYKLNDRFGASLGTALGIKSLQVLMSWRRRGRSFHHSAKIR